MSHFKESFFAEPLAKLHALCFDEPWSEDNFRKILDLPTTFGLGDAFGFVLCADLGEDLEILTLAVHPDKRRNGVASRLLEQLQQMAFDQSKHHIFLEVRATNEPAIQLYKKHGFIQTGVRPNYYHEKGGTFDALCLTWTNPRL